MVVKIEIKRKNMYKVMQTMLQIHVPDVCQLIDTKENITRLVYFKNIVAYYYVDSSLNAPFWLYSIKMYFTSDIYTRNHLLTNFL